jgi:hypothetical protein
MLSNILLSRIISVGFDVTDQLGEKMGVQSAIHRLQESLLSSEEGSFVQYSHRVCGTHETSQVD